jgi:alcohol dehydrogenase class IV
MSPVAGVQYRYAAPTELGYGRGSIARLGAEVKRLGGQRVTLVSDAGLAKAGVVQRAADSLRDAGLAFDTDFNVPVDPTFEDVDRLVALVRANRSDTVVSFGSGSVMAAGRSAAVAAAHEGSSVALAGVDKATQPPLISICVPTTAGSGGEVSRQATITDPEGHKSGIQGWAVAERLAILDAELLVSVPRRQAVASGVDALVHALEAYVSRRHTLLTDALALPSFEVIYRDLPKAVEQPTVELLDGLLLASTMANLACGNAGLGLIHGLNKGITYLFHTGRYNTLSYGDLHSVLMPFVNAFNVPAAPERFATLARLMGVPADVPDREAADQSVTLIRDWLAGLGAPRKLPWDDCPPEDIDVIVDDVNGRQMAKDNPRESSPDDLRELVRSSIAGW